MANITSSFDPISDAELRLFESQIKIPLPTEYRAFLLSTNGGQPRPNRFRIRSDTTAPYSEGVVSWLFGVHMEPRENLRSELSRYKVRHVRLPADLFPIGRDDFGNRICLSVSGPNQGRVYFWDHEDEPEIPSMENCYDIARSFGDFINALR